MSRPAQGRVKCLWNGAGQCALRGEGAGAGELSDGLNAFADAVRYGRVVGAATGCVVGGMGMVILLEPLSIFIPAIAMPPMPIPLIPPIPMPILHIGIDMAGRVVLDMGIMECIPIIPIVFMHGSPEAAAGRVVGLAAAKLTPRASKSVTRNVCRMASPFRKTAKSTLYFTCSGEQNNRAGD